jgi:hypothetical protein
MTGTADTEAVEFQAIYNLEIKTCGSNNEYWYFWGNKSSKLFRESYVYILLRYELINN